ncbi:MAG: hypothetical protein WDW38_009812 [Sanguina aurantia]
MRALKLTGSIQKREATPSTEVSEESVVPAAAEEVQVLVVAEEKEEGEIVDDAAEAQPEVEVVLAAGNAAAAAEAAEQETKPEAVVAVESKEEVPESPHPPPSSPSPSPPSRPSGPSSQAPPPNPYPPAKPPAPPPPLTADYPSDAPFWAPVPSRCTPATAHIPPSCPASQYCEPRPANPYALLCRPCAQACSICSSPAHTSDAVALTAHHAFSAAAAPAPLPAHTTLHPTSHTTTTTTTTPNTPSVCSAGTFCASATAPAAAQSSPPGRTCTSCYSCLNNTDVAIGTCRQACGFSARSEWPSQGLPVYDSARPTLSDLLIPPLIDAAAWMTSSISATHSSNASDFRTLMASLDLGSMPTAQQQHLMTALDVAPRDGVITPEELVLVTVLRTPGYSLMCPTDQQAFTSGTAWPGCACLAVPLDQLTPSHVAPGELAWLTAIRSSHEDYSLVADCVAGFRCSGAAASALRGTLRRASLSSALGLCVPCLVGEYCPSGTLERTVPLLDACISNSAAGVLGSDTQSAVDCGNAKPCPPGSFCPGPGVLNECGEGEFCSQGTAEPSTCDLSTIISQQRYQLVQPQAQLVVLDISTHGLGLTGNSCPKGSPNPFAYCPAGSFCSNASSPAVLCPVGSYCPLGSIAPKHCNAMLDCSSVGTAQPKIAWWGLLAFLAIISSLPILLLLTYQSMSLAEGGGNRGSEDRLSDFLNELYWLDFLTLTGRGVAKEGFSSTLSISSKQQGASKVLAVMPQSSLGMLGQGKPAAASELAFDIDDFTSQKQRRALKVMSGHGGYGKISPNFALQFSDLSLVLTSGKPVLNRVSGSFPHSHLHAIMGPSGCGKSSLLSLFSGKPLNTVLSCGKVEVQQYQAGVSWGEAKPLSDIRYLVGFVPQDDILHESLTVLENLEYAAALRLPTHGTWMGKSQQQAERSTSPSDRAGVVSSVLQLLGLTPVQHRVVRGPNSRQQAISGGQRKRVNIGLELVAKPSILFLDEPTSGLDSAVSQDILDYMSVIAKAGMNVIAVVHQPRYSIFAMFDMVLLLAQGGNTVYMGPVHWLHPYFEWLGFPLPQENEIENPADVYLDIISGMVPRADDEDFVPKELPLVWNDIGLQWLRTQSITQLIASNPSHNQTSSFAPLPTQPALSNPYRQFSRQPSITRSRPRHDSATSGPQNQTNEALAAKVQPSSASELALRSRNLTLRNPFANTHMIRRQAARSRQSSETRNRAHSMAAAVANVTGLFGDASSGGTLAIPPDAMTSKTEGNVTDDAITSEANVTDGASPGEMTAVAGLEMGAAVRASSHSTGANTAAATAGVESGMTSMDTTFSVSISAQMRKYHSARAGHGWDLSSSGPARSQPALLTVEIQGSVRAEVPTTVVASVAVDAPADGRQGAVILHSVVRVDHHGAHQADPAALLQQTPLSENTADHDSFSESNAPPAASDSNAPPHGGSLLQQGNASEGNASELPFARGRQPHMNTKVTFSDSLSSAARGGLTTSNSHKPYSSIHSIN